MAFSDKAKAILRNKLSEVKILIIDEISMVSRDLFYKTHARLLEIFVFPTVIPFANLSVVVLRDSLQLPSVRGNPIYSLIDDHERIKGFLSFDLWNIFKFAELKEVMKQKGT